ncbi:MAG: DUF2490 domain-containing protein [Bacteroidota bacterium]
MRQRHSLIFLVFTLISTSAIAQSTTLAQWDPGLSFTQKFPNRWSLNVNTLQRSNLAEYEPEGTQQNFRWNLNETQFFATYELWKNKKISGGYAFQVRASEPDEFHEHRLMEQFAFVTYALGGKRIAHRVRLEQRIRDSELTNRMRYRLGFDSPLNGERLDPGEFYGIVTNEFLWSFNRTGQSGENRLFAGIGWFFNRQYKLQTGLMYRLSRRSANYLNILAISTTLYINNQKKAKQ